ncbi:hypothetical protein T492DRAFT_915790 [Pavlovales sp. CCMP2436]|nr:hypothetical protein T492DRAFT_915790 [Pavlovales sp. CCMP2436]
MEATEATATETDRVSGGWRPRRRSGSNPRPHRRSQRGWTTSWWPPSRARPCTLPTCDVSIAQPRPPTVRVAAVRDGGARRRSVGARCCWHGRYSPRQLGGNRRASSRGPAPASTSAPSCFRHCSAWGSCLRAAWMTTTAAAATPCTSALKRTPTLASILPRHGTRSFRPALGATRCTPRTQQPRARRSRSRCGCSAARLCSRRKHAFVGNLGLAA